MENTERWKMYKISRRSENNEPIKKLNHDPSYILKKGRINTKKPLSSWQYKCSWQPEESSLSKNLSGLFILSILGAGGQTKALDLKAWENVFGTGDPLSAYAQRHPFTNSLKRKGRSQKLFNVEHSKELQPKDAPILKRAHRK